MKQTYANFSTWTISSEDNPPESPSESTWCLLQVQWDISTTVTLGKNHKYYGHYGYQQELIYLGE